MKKRYVTVLLFLMVWGVFMLGHFPGSMGQSKNKNFVPGGFHYRRIRGRQGRSLPGPVGAET